MALLKPLETEYGVVAEYWKVMSVNGNWIDKVGNIVLVGYVSQDLR